MCPVTFDVVLNTSGTRSNVTGHLAAVTLVARREPATADEAEREDAAADAPLTTADAATA